jgi:hypothetical protein
LAIWSDPIGPLPANIPWRAQCSPPGVDVQGWFAEGAAFTGITPARLIAPEIAALAVVRLDGW